MKTLALRLAAVAALAGAASCRPLEETRSLNFDPETTAGALESGWDRFEKSDSGDTFVWARAREARLVVQSRADGGRLVRFRCWPFAYPGAPPQTLTLSVNGRRFETITLGGDAGVYAFDVPEDAWTRGANTLAFTFAYAESPKQRIAGATDARTLAAAFDWLEVLSPAPKR